MRISKRYAAGVLAAFAMGEFASAHDPPPLDRPTPPPCCADGLCYPNPTTWGVYPTRWRRWPGVVDAALEPSPAPEPGELGPEVPSYEPPPAEEEDRRAPPPTQRRRPAAPPAEEEAGPGGPPEGEDGAPSFESPSFDRPSLEERPAETPGIPTFPWDQPAPEAEPTSDADPPPAPPFASFRQKPSVPSVVRASNAAERPVVTPKAVRRQNSSTNDAPPPLPLAFHANGY